jgi:hypothetical protein
MLHYVEFVVVVQCPVVVGGFGGSTAFGVDTNTLLVSFENWVFKLGVYPARSVDLSGRLGSKSVFGQDCFHGVHFNLQQSRLVKRIFG